MATADSIASPDLLYAPIQRAFLADEGACIAELLRRAAVDAPTAARIKQHAANLVTAVRGQRASGIESFMRQYDLATHEGVLLMCVAEALLRIPDAATADALIRDKFSQGEWKRHLGQSRSWLVNASTWGMLLAGRLADVPAVGETDALSRVEKLFTRLSEPVARQAIKAAMGIMAEQFVMGADINSAVARSRDEDNARYRHSFDMLGEAALTQADAEKYFAAYANAIAVIAADKKSASDIFSAPSISVKLSALHPRFEPLQKNRVMQELTPRVLALCEQARDAQIGLTLDAEEAERLDLQLSVYKEIFCNKKISNWHGFGLAVQGYQKRAPHVIAWLAQLAKQTTRRIPVRLVKGAYWDTEIKRAQTQGLASYPVYTRKISTDVAYLACANALLAEPSAFYAQFATHNAHTVSYILERAQGRDDYEFQRLHGMGEALYKEVLRDGACQCRVYAPVGEHADLLPYLVRRLLENGANTSFVNRIADEAAPVEQVVADPLAAVRGLNVIANPRIPLPQDLYQPVRKNSAGISFADAEALKKLLHAMHDDLHQTKWTASPLCGGKIFSGPPRKLTSPTDRRIEIGVVHEASQKEIEAALAATSHAAPAWSATPAAIRAEILERAADSLEKNRGPLMALLVREAGKTLPDAQSEVREAADFCRYYALQARKLFAAPEILKGPTGELNQLSLHGRGVFACISPWNFPLAIFVGQIAAALAAGNGVIAKPAEQTPLIAFFAVKILLEAGVPADVLALLPGDGATAGAALVRDERVNGVVFTGSTATALIINRALAARTGPIVPFIAETGGINAMLADSSALPEQVVNDVMTSAFNSAGQRCSALRVLLVQNDIADRVLHLLKGALAEWRIGDPAQLTTDIGPVIDADALALLQSHQKKMRASAKTLYEMPLPAQCEHGTFFAPCIYELTHLDQLESEVFGPILHVIRFSANRLDDMLNQINAKGFGLTLGIHSRIDDTIEYITARAKVGNLYVNRNIIGAVVGVQPFGGEGLSGTGPKAGGPHYLLRFATERTLTVNTAAVGGNAGLLAESDDQ
jgi:RHH-type transcriptional regulator, proline utilization regulon repressor / proline dehydrogenase / delta 1-pyrroline-5-carboxylate dehydrogenase